MMRLTEFRQSQRLSKSALARKASMHVSSVCQIENGCLYPYPGQAKKLAKALGWEGDPSELFRDSEKGATRV